MSTKIRAVIFWMGLMFVLIGYGPQMSRNETRNSQRDYWRSVEAKEDLFQKFVSTNKDSLTPLALLNALAYAGQTQNKFLAQQRWVLLPRKWKNERLLLGASIKGNPDFQKLSTQDFLNLWNQLWLATSAEDRSYLMGSAFNGAWSIMLDPHTKLVPSDFIKDAFNHQGIRKNGLGLMWGRINKEYFVKRVYPESQAEQLGIRRGDRLVSVDRIKASEFDEISLARVLENQRARNRWVQTAHHVLKFERWGGGQNFQVILKPNPNVLSYVRISSIGVVKRIVHVELFRFASGVCEQIHDSFAKMNLRLVNGLILDLRDNSGGEIQEAQCLLELFLGEKTFFSLRFRDGETQPYRGSKPALVHVPMVVLQNSQSGSASEIVSGVLQEFSRATVIGERSFGKGSFQTLVPWTFLPGVTLVETQGLYIFPSGKSPQSVGIYPDIEVDEEFDDPEREEDSYFAPIHRQKNKTDPTHLDSVLKCQSFEPSELERSDLSLRIARGIFYCPYENEKLFKGNRHE